MIKQTKNSMKQLPTTNSLRTSSTVSAEKELFLIVCTKNLKSNCMKKGKKWLTLLKGQITLTNKEIRHTTKYKR